MNMPAKTYPSVKSPNTDGNTTSIEIGQEVYNDNFVSEVNLYVGGDIETMVENFGAKRTYTEGE